MTGVQTCALPICFPVTIGKGLRERILSVTDGSPIELTEKVVEEFVDEVPMAVKLERFRKTKKRVVDNSVNNKKINNSGKKGLKVSGEWNLPDNCRGGVSVCIVDKRMKRSKEATLGAYHAPACKKNFSFKLIPNYSITSEDAEKHPWQVLVNIKGVAMEEGYCPLSLEFVSICVVHKNNVRKGLRERILRVTDGLPIELTEKVVEEFVDEVPMAVKLERFRKTKKRVVGNSVNNKKINNSGKKGLKV